MEKTLLFLLALALIHIAKCRDLKTIRRKRALSPGQAEERNESPTICIEDLGCYPDINPKGLKALLPGQTSYFADSRVNVDTQFMWWTTGAQAAKVITNQKFEVNGFDSRLKVKFIVHGFMARYAEWALIMKDAFLRKEKCNVFIVNWNAFGSYLSETSNTYVVGAEMGNFIVQLVETTGLKVEDIHIVGHSLGAHISGYAGKWVKGKLGKPVGRITGLDPASPLYLDVIPGARLDMEDAAFVDVIHTPTGEYITLGLLEAVGHFDFYPNGGNVQPGCKELSVLNKFELFEKYQNSEPLTEDDTNDISCSHSRATFLFIESIESDSCKFFAHQCPSFEAYTEGKCPSGKEGTLRVQMGYHADEYKKYIDEEQHKSFFLETNSEPPYCKAE